MNTSVPKWSLVQSATVDIDLHQVLALVCASWHCCSRTNLQLSLRGFGRTHRCLAAGQIKCQHWGHKGSVSWDTNASQFKERFTRMCQNPNGSIRVWPRRDRADFNKPSFFSTWAGQSGRHYAQTLWGSSAGHDSIERKCFVSECFSRAMRALRQVSHGHKLALNQLSVYVCVAFADWNRSNRGLNQDGVHQHIEKWHSRHGSGAEGGTGAFCVKSCIQHLAPSKKIPSAMAGNI